MNDEHRAYKDYIGVIIDIDRRVVIIFVVFSSFASLRRALGHGDIHLSRNGFFFIIRKLHLEVQLNELFRILRATFHWLGGHHAL